MIYILSQRRKELTAEMLDLRKARTSQEELLAQLTQRMLETQGALAEVDKIEKLAKEASGPTKMEEVPF